MKISLNWLKDHVEIPNDITIEKLMYDLTMRTVEVEGAERMTEKLHDIVVGKIEEVLPHPNADKLRICMTDVGSGEIKQIVCGGSNLAPGMKVAVSCPGAMVRWHGEGEPVEVKIAKLRGVESWGMICSSTEIGLFDLFPFTEDATILDLSSFDAEPGTNVAEAIGIDDVVLEIDNKSLTNRPDLWGHYGIARELSAIYDVKLAPLPTPDLPRSDDGLRVEINDPDRCRRYVGVAIDGLSTEQASFKVRSRIWLVGMRPINAIVDITNYVMLAVGQPSHAFDRDNIVGGITVRRAAEGEKLALLNGRDASIDSSDLVIADDIEPVGLAGIMGGSKDSILPTTKRVILEIANFDPLSTRRTAQKNDLRTEASMRYEKGLDPQRIDMALALALSMFADEFPSCRAAGIVDVYPRPLERARVILTEQWLAERTGKRLGSETIRSMLERLGFDVSIKDGEIDAVAPTWRSTGDISLPDDVMEEVARLYGYENYEASPITSTFTSAIRQPEIELTRRVREYLSFRCGMNEIFTYPWVSDMLLDASGIGHDEALAISTPPAPDERYIRPSLVPGSLGAVAANTRYFDQFKIYELTQIFKNTGFSTPYNEREHLPLQRRHLAGALVRAEGGSISELYREAKGIIENMPRFIHAAAFSFEQRSRPCWADDTVWMNVIASDGTQIGQLALVSKKTALACGIKQHSVMMFELDTDAIAPLASRTNRFEHLPELPRVNYDISMIFDESVTWAQIAAAAITKNDERDPNRIVRSASFVDVYRGKQIPNGKKSITLRLVIGSDKKTLTGDEIEKAAAIVSKRLTKQLGGELRT